MKELNVQTDDRDVIIRGQQIASRWVESISRDTVTEMALIMARQEKVIAKCTVEIDRLTKEIRILQQKLSLTE